MKETARVMVRAIASVRARVTGSGSEDNGLG